MKLLLPSDTIKMIYATPGVSVVITCFNLQEFISAAIESVLCQVYEGELQVIVVDDASTDSSRSVINNHTGVELLALESNVGVLLATIAGIEHANHDLIFFLDGDDLWMPDKIRLVVEAFCCDKNIGLVTHDINCLDERTGNIQYRPFIASNISGSARGTLDFVKHGIIRYSGRVWLGSAYSIRKSKVEIEAFCCWARSLPNPIETYQDWPLAYWCASLRSVKCSYVPHQLMLYRIHSSNYSGDARSVVKAIRNLRKSYFTADANCRICRLRDLQGYPAWICRNRKLFYAFMIELYSGNIVFAICIFARLQAYLVLSSESLFKEWLRFIFVILLGPRRFTLFLKGV